MDSVSTYYFFGSSNVAYDVTTKSLLKCNDSNIIDSCSIDDVVSYVLANNIVYINLVKLHLPVHRIYYFDPIWFLFGYGGIWRFRPYNESYYLDFLQLDSSYIFYGDINETMMGVYSNKIAYLISLTSWSVFNAYEPKITITDFRYLDSEWIIYSNEGKLISMNTLKDRKAPSGGTKIGLHENGDGGMWHQGKWYPDKIKVLTNESFHASEKNVKLYRNSITIDDLKLDLDIIPFRVSFGYSPIPNKAWFIFENGVTSVNFPCDLQTECDQMISTLFWEISEKPIGIKIINDKVFILGKSNGVVVQNGLSIPLKWSYNRAWGNENSCYFQVDDGSIVSDSGVKFDSLPENSEEISLIDDVRIGSTRWTIQSGKLKISIGSENSIDSIGLFENTFEFSKVLIGIYFI